MRLLTELIETPIRVIEEANESGKRQFIEGIFMQGGVPNRNNRIYPVNTLRNEVNRFIKENVSKARAYGELNHPSGPNINADRIAIHIKEIRQDSGNFYGKALIASTPMGDIVKGLINDGANLGVSSRALGSLKPIQEGLNEVQNDLKLLAVDVVTDPSAPDAYVNGIFENKEWIFNPVSGMWIEQEVKMLKNMSAKKLEEEKIEAFKRYLNALVNNPNS